MDTETALQQLEFMNEALNALRYLDTLLDVSLHTDGGVLSDPASGLHCLMKAHLDSLGDGIDLLGGFVRQRDNARQELPEGWVTPPIYRPGMEHEMRAKVTASEAAERLRGADLGAVARDTNLKEETVRRVVERLLDEAAPEPGAAARNG